MPNEVAARRWERRAAPLAAKEDQAHRQEASGGEPGGRFQEVSVGGRSGGSGGSIPKSGARVVWSFVPTRLPELHRHQLLQDGIVFIRDGLDLDIARYWHGALVRRGPA